MSYNWDLIERLLHEVQNSADKNFAPRAYAGELAQELERAGEHTNNLDALKAEAADYESQLLGAGFIEPRPEGEGGLASHEAMHRLGQNGPLPDGVNARLLKRRPDHGRRIATDEEVRIIRHGEVITHLNAAIGGAGQP